MKKLAVVSRKGGVGKSTIAVQLSHGLAKLGYKVLLIDLDGQNDSSLFLGFTSDDYEKTFYHLLDNRYPATLEECIINARENLDLLPNSQIEEINAEFHREPRIDIIMSEVLKDLDSMEYDFIIFDSGPQRTRVNDAILCYIDKAIVPVQMEAASVRSVGNIYEYLSDLRLDPEKVALIIPNMLDIRTKDAKENLKLLKKIFADEIEKITPPIHRRVRITEAGKKGKTVFEYDKEAADQFFRILEKVVKDIA